MYIANGSFVAGSRSVFLSIKKIELKYIVDTSISISKLEIYENNEIINIEYFKFKLFSIILYVIVAMGEL